MKDIFIADAHLKNPSDDNYIQLLKFLKQNRGEIRTLILLGDIFEFWIGYRYCVYSAHIPLLHELSAHKQEGTKIVMVEGNHDFNVGPFFSETLEARIIPDGACITLGETRIWVEHGDLITPNRSYLWLRKLFRSRVVRILSRIIHPDLVWKFAAHLGNWSKKKRVNQDKVRPNGYSKTSTCTSVPREKIIAAAHQRFEMGCDALVCGHFHNNWQQLRLKPQIIVVGEWGKLGNYVEHDKGIFTVRHFITSPTADPED
ncbi:MAG: UDP-2,3-diacylglucosamine diphosphatase [Desulfuromonadaceae bacterium]